MSLSSDVGDPIGDIEIATSLLDAINMLRAELRIAFPQPEYSKHVSKKLYLFTAAAGPLNVIVGSAKLRRQFNVLLVTANPQEDKPYLQCEDDDDIFVINVSASTIYLGFDVPLDATNGIPLAANRMWINGMILPT